MLKVTLLVLARETARMLWWRGQLASTSNLARRESTASTLTSTPRIPWLSTNTSTERQVQFVFLLIFKCRLILYLLPQWLVLTYCKKSFFFFFTQDHDKRRHLSHKFCMTAAGEFKWNGSINGSKVLTISTLRLTIIQLENNVPAPLMHPNWASHR